MFSPTFTFESYRRVAGGLWIRRNWFSARTHAVTADERFETTGEQSRTTAREVFGPSTLKYRKRKPVCFPRRLIETRRLGRVTLRPVRLTRRALQASVVCCYFVVKRADVRKNRSGNSFRFGDV